MPQCDLKSHFSMGALLYICCIFPEHLFLRTPLEGCFRLFIEKQSSYFYFSGQVGVRPIARGRGRTAAGSRSAGGRAYVLNGFLPQLHPILQASVGGTVNGLSTNMGRGNAPRATEVPFLKIKQSS